MKRILNILFIAVMLPAAANALPGWEKVRVSDVEVVDADSTADVRFTIRIDKKAVKSSEILVFTPVLSDGQFRVSLEPVAVVGKRARVLWNRADWIAERAIDRSALRMLPADGTPHAYNSSVPLQEWMLGAKLEMEGALGGCCSFTEHENLLVADKVMSPKIPKVAVKVEDTDVFVPETIADTLLMTFTFIAHNSEFDENEPIKMLDEERKHSLVIYFKSGESLISDDYADNGRTLGNLIGSVRMILESDNSDVERVVIAGFSSPEGSYDLNDRLAWERAVSIKEYIMENTELSADYIKVYNGSVDWRGLRIMVAGSDMESREEVIGIIDDVPAWSDDGKMLRTEMLKSLDGGKPYKYMHDNFFPKLRNGAFIKVYYNNK